MTNYNTRIWKDKNLERGKLNPWVYYMESDDKDEKPSEGTIGNPLQDLYFEDEVILQLMSEKGINNTHFYEVLPERDTLDKSSFEVKFIEKRYSTTIQITTCVRHRYPEEEITSEAVITSLQDRIDSIREMEVCRSLTNGEIRKSWTEVSAEKL